MKRDRSRRRTIASAKRAAKKARKNTSAKRAAKRAKKVASAKRVAKAKATSELKMARLSVADQRLKIIYLIPHPPQDLSTASPFGFYTSGLHHSAAMISTASVLPADIREPFTTPESVLQLRLRRVLWRNVIPIQMPSLEKASQLGDPFLFRVVFTNDAQLALAVDELIFADKVPFLHVSSVEGAERVPAGDFGVDRLLDFVDSVLTHLSSSPEWVPFVTVTRKLLCAADRQPRRTLGLRHSFHNVTTPNELALISFGWDLDGDDPLVVDNAPDSLRDPQRYIDRICAVADTVASERKKLMSTLPASLQDWAYLITVLSVHWGHYRSREDFGELDPTSRDVLQAVFKGVIQQSSYFDTYKAASDKLFEHPMFRVLTASRTADQRCYTAGLALLATATLAPVLRLEPRLNQIRGELKILAHCVRSDGRVHSQFKQSRLARVAGQHMRSLIDPKFMTRIDQHAAESEILGLKVVADVPLEWMECSGVPLGLRYDLSRIPVLPGNLFLSQCVAPPVFVTVDDLLDILVIRSFQADDPLKPLLKEAIGRTLKYSRNRQGRIRIVDVNTVDELVQALSTFSGAVLIFDGHGDYEDHNGVGTIVIGGKSIEVWELKNQCTFPPIVLFSACDTHPLDGSHGSCANAAFTLGAVTVLATSLPISALNAALFIGRLMLRMRDFVPEALELRELLTWREVIAGMLRMSFTSEVTRLLIDYAALKVEDTARERVQLAANIAINARRADWFEIYVDALSKGTLVSVDALRELIARWTSMTDTHKYVQLGSPENVVIVSDHG